MTLTIRPIAFIALLIALLTLYIVRKPAATIAPPPPIRKGETSFNPDNVCVPTEYDARDNLDRTEAKIKQEYEIYAKR